MTQLASQYQQHIEAGEIQLDPAQQQVVEALDALLADLQAEQNSKGLYLFGPVGRGKSMLTNMFFAAVTVPKRRVHFHAFMEEVHQRLHEAPRGTDVMVHIAESIRHECQLLLFDEFYVTNIADAMLLGRLFEKLLKAGVVVVATSNWPPEDLFQGGINRHQFMPFIQLIENQLKVVELDGAHDWRAQNNDGLPLVIDAAQPKAFSVLFEEYASTDAKECELPTDIPFQKHVGGAVWYVFDDLCAAAVGREDYLQLTQAADTVFVADIPKMNANEADATLRFITLIDILYENKCRVVLSTAYPLTELCAEGPAAFPFQRCVSRLLEMQGWA